MRLTVSLIAATALTACSPAPTPADQPKTATTASASAAVPSGVVSDAPAGEYTMDLGHTSVTLRVSHLGFSRYTARFTKVDGKLNFDPSNPANQSVRATIDAGSIQTNYPDPKLDFDSMLEKEFLETAKYPTITFVSTKVTPTGANTADVTGDLTLHGVTRPVTLKATFNGGYKPNSMDPSGARIGFSAHGTFKRSDFGIKYGLPAPGTNMGVGDEVEVIIESEFTRKP